MIGAYVREGVSKLLSLKVNTQYAQTAKDLWHVRL